MPNFGFPLTFPHSYITGTVRFGLTSWSHNTVGMWKGNYDLHIITSTTGASVANSNVVINSMAFGN